jgi:hypothetical protein
MDQKEKHQVLFTHLVISLHSATMQQLGKLKNPLSGTVERDLGGAQGTIDMLEMLREKTRGNLGEEEGRLLTQVLHELRLNYVDEMGKQPPAPQAAPVEGGQPDAPGGKP